MESKPAFKTIGKSFGILMFLFTFCRPVQKDMVSLRFCSVWRTSKTYGKVVNLKTFGNP